MERGVDGGAAGSSLSWTWKPLFIILISGHSSSEISPHASILPVASLCIASLFTPRVSFLNHHLGGFSERIAVLQLPYKPDLWREGL